LAVPASASKAELNQMLAAFLEEQRIAKKEQVKDDF
jgi:hypothetical protein